MCNSLHFQLSNSLPNQMTCSTTFASYFTHKFLFSIVFCSIFFLCFVCIRSMESIKLIFVDPPTLACKNTLIAVQSRRQISLIAIQFWQWNNKKKENDINSTIRSIWSNNILISIWRKKNSFLELTMKKSTEQLFFSRSLWSSRRQQQMWQLTEHKHVI